MATYPAQPAQPVQHRGLNWRRVDWWVVFGIGTMHLVALLAFLPQFFSWSGLALLAVFAWLTGNIGITLCFHRLLTHRSFKTPKWFEYFLTICGCLAWQGAPVNWVGTHRLHHKHSDSEHDPHTPKHGFTWAHMLWCMHKDEEGMRSEDAAKDLLRDPVLRWLNRWFAVPQFILIALLLGVGWAVGGWTLAISWVVWGVALRTVLVFHGTWFVNSAAHTWGYRNFQTKDGSTNLWWVALISFGEGWHNNHHAHQRSAAHGLRWYEFDITYWMIRALGKVGLARDIVVPSEDKMPE